RDLIRIFLGRFTSNSLAALSRGRENRMKPGKLTHTLAALLSSITSLFAHGAVTKAEPTKVKLSKKSEKKSEGSRIGVESLAFAPSHLRSAPPLPGEGYPWKHQIVTTVFWRSEERRVGKECRS